MERVVKLIDFNVYNGNEGIQTSDEEYKPKCDNSNFMIQMFGVDEHGRTSCIIAQGFKPFFYIMVNDSWNIQTKTAFLAHIKEKLASIMKSQSVTA